MEPTNMGLEKEELLGEEEEDDHCTTAGSGITGGDPTDNSDDNTGDRVVEKLELPEEYRKLVMVLKGESSYVEGCCDVYLVGTCHFSQESCRVVEAVISSLKPKVVSVESCLSRFSPMLYSHILQKREPVEYMSVIKEMWKKNWSIFEIFWSLVSSKLARKLDVVPGAEFLVAYKEAEKCGAVFHLIDRPIEITLERTRRKMSLWQKLKDVCIKVFLIVFMPEREELDEMFNDVDKQSLMTQKMCVPSALEDTFVHERDRYMTYNLWALAHHHSSMVAVVGLVHLQGIKKNWSQRPTATLEELEELPGTSTVKKILYLVVVVVVGIAIVSRMYLSF